MFTGDDFENSFGTNLAVGRHLLGQLHASLGEKLVDSSDDDSALIDPEVPDNWDHVIWFAHARVDPLLRIRRRILVPTPTFLFSFRVTVDPPTAPRPRSGYHVGEVRVYDGFDPWQLSRAMSFVLQHPAELFSRYLAVELGEPHGTPVAALERIKGQALLLGPDGLLSALRFQFRT